MARHILTVLSNATEGADTEFNDWYTNTHLGDVVKVRGFTAAQRYKLSNVQLGAGDLPYKYLAIYEVEIDDLAETSKALQDGASGTMYISPTLDRERTAAWFFTPITESVTRDEPQPAAMQSGE